MLDGAVVEIAAEAGAVVVDLAEEDLLLVGLADEGGEAAELGGLAQERQERAEFVVGETIGNAGERLENPEMQAEAEHEQAGEADGGGGGEFQGVGGGEESGFGE
jgi:hypothetical protein